MAAITIRIDDADKKELDSLIDEMGLNISTFYGIYTKRVLRDRRIPFDISASADPFYSKSNIEQIKKADQQIKHGQVVVKTLDELEKMANE